MITLVTEPLELSFFKGLLQKTKGFAKNTFIPKRGPGAVVDSLIRGLKQNRVPFNLNPSHDDFFPVVFVIRNPKALRTAIKLKEAGKIKTLFAGPNIVVRPTDQDSLITHPAIDRYYVNSQWTKDAYLIDAPTLETRLQIWAAGVDEKFWVPKTNHMKGDNHGDRILLYWKTEKKDFIDQILDKIKDAGFTPVLIRYGTYKNHFFKKILETVRAAVFVSRTESQGIALAEAWAMNVPTFPWNPKIFKHANFVFENASSCPYLTSNTGADWKELTELSSLLKKLKQGETNFSPREWVLENMTDSICAKNLLEYT